MDYGENARRHRHQAEECRAKADLMADEATRTQYQQVADSYDAIADSEERLALTSAAV